MENKEDIYDKKDLKNEKSENINRNKNKNENITLLLNILLMNQIYNTIT